MNIPAALIAAVVALSAAYMTGRAHGGDKVREQWDKAKAEQVAAALVAEQEARRAEQERATAAQEIATNARRQVARARADAASAAAAADSLRDAARAAADRASACNPSAAGRSAADSLADVLAEVERAGRAVAGEADAAVIAGQACERAYSALTDSR